MALQSHDYLIQRARILFNQPPHVVAGALYGQPDPIEQSQVPGLIAAWTGTPTAATPPPPPPAEQAVVVDYSRFTDGTVPAYNSATHGWDPTAAGVGGLPSGGTDGQILAKSGVGVVWEDPPAGTGGGGSGLPSGGVPGDSLMKDSGNAPAWIARSGIFRGDWAQGAVYNANDLVAFGGVLYRITTGHTSGASFDTAKTAVLRGAGIQSGTTAPTGTPADGQAYIQTDPFGVIAMFIGSGGSWVSFPVNSGPVVEADLDAALSAKVNTRVPSGRRVPTTGTLVLGAAQTVTLTEADDQGQIDIWVDLTQAGGILTIAGVQLVTRCTFRIFPRQDAAGNRDLTIKNGTSGDAELIGTAQGLDPTGGVTSFIYALIDDGTNIVIVNPGVVASSGGGSGTGIANPSFTGTMGAPNVLTAVDPPSAVVDSYQWQLSSDGGATWTNIAGATTNTYTQQSSDAGKKIRVQIIARPQVASASADIPSTDLFEVGTASQGTGTSTTLKVNKPTGAVEGDLLYAVIDVTVANADLAATGTPIPTGWFPVASDPVANPHGRYTNSGGLTAFVFWHRIAAGEVATSWNFTGAASYTYRSRTVAVRNALPGDNTVIPHTQVTSANGVFGTAVTLPAKTPSSSTGRMYMSAVAFTGSFNITWPTTEPTVNDVSGSDYGKMQYKLIPAGPPTAFGPVNGVVSAGANKTVISWLVLPLAGA
jgi:hypothetical protein